MQMIRHSKRYGDEAPTPLALPALQVAESEQEAECEQQVQIQAEQDMEQEALPQAYHPGHERNWRAITDHSIGVLDPGLVRVHRPTSHGQTCKFTRRAFMLSSTSSVSDTPPPPL